MPDTHLIEEKLLTKGAKKVLVVEDHDDTRRVVVMLLEACGYHVQSAGSFTDAAAMLSCQPFDVLISDIGLPDGTGLELISHSIDKKIKGIALTGRDEEDDIDRATAAGFAVHLTKPADFESLRRAVENVLTNPG